MNYFNLDNGIRVVCEKIDYVKSLSIGVYVGVGSAREQKEENGISHFLEHMFFKGTKTRSAKEIAEFMDFCGGQLNAVTSKEYTCYYAKVLENHRDKAFEILSDMLTNSTFTKENIEIEKKVISEEIKIGEDTPEELIFDLISELTWQKSPLGFPVAGTIDGVSKINRDMILDFYKKYYPGNNMVISVVGSFDENSIKDELDHYFGGIPTLEYEKEKKEIPKVESGILVRKKDIEQCQLCISFEGLSRSDEYVYDLLSANAMFGGSMSSRLFQKIREENGLSYSVYSYLNTYSDCGSFVIYAGMNPDELEKVLCLINDEINLIKKEGLSEKEILCSTEQLKSSIIMGIESMSNRMSNYGKNLLLQGEIDDYDALMRKISRVDTKRTKEIIERIFVPEKMNIAVLGNVKEKDFREYFSF